MNDGAYLKVGLFDDREVLVREIYVKCPGIMIPDKTMDVLYEQYIQPTYKYGGNLARRTLVYSYPEDAVRELIVNAVVHMDYSYREPITIAVYLDRLEIGCMGSLPEGWTTDMLLERHRSVKRNRRLADVFHSAGFIEAWGQGIKKVMDDCASNGNPMPEFKIITGALVSILHPKPIEERIDVKTDDSSLDDTDTAIIDQMLNDPSITISAIANAIGVSRRTVNNHIYKMRNSGLIEREGADKTGKWKVLL